MSRMRPSRPRHIDRPPFTNAPGVLRGSEGVSRESNLHAAAPTEKSPGPGRSMTDPTAPVPPPAHMVAEPSGRRSAILKSRRSSAGTALILLALIVLPSALLGFLSWRAIEK